MRIAIALCGLSLFAGMLRAADLSGPAEPLSTAIEKEPVDLIPPLYRAYVNCQTEKFTFLLPGNFRLAGDQDHGRLELVNVQNNCVISFAIFHPIEADSGEGLKGVYRQWLASRYTNGTISQEFSRPVLGRNALMFDIEWKGAGGLVQKTRAAYVHTTSGLLEAIVTSGPKDSATAQSSLNDVLASLCESVDGKLQIHRIANVN
jgi:hypothetical protein